MGHSRKILIVRKKNFALRLSMLRLLNDERKSVPRLASASIIRIEFSRMSSARLVA